MHTIYLYLGFIVFWGLIATVLVCSGVFAWEANWFLPVKRQATHARLGLMLLWGHYPKFTEGGAKLFIRIARGRGWAQWERNLLAIYIKHARKTGFAK